MDPETTPDPVEVSDAAAFWTDPAAIMEYVYPLATSLALALVVIIAGWMISKWVNRLVYKASIKAKMAQELAGFFGSMARYVVLAATVISALGRVGVETTSLLTIFASAGLAVGLALQGSLGSFAAGVMILFFRPFSLGDKVTAGGHTGVVEDIGLFATTFCSPNNDVIIIPNSAITGGSIVNHTVRGVIRGDISVGVAYGTDMQLALKVCADAANGSDLVLDDPAAAVAFVNFGGSSLDFCVMCWTNAADYLDMLHDVKVRLYNALNEAGIDIPFDQIVIHNAAMAEAAAAK